jgi:hypothetical protein
MEQLKNSKKNAKIPSPAPSLKVAGLGILAIFSASAKLSN